MNLRLEFAVFLALCNTASAAAIEGEKSAESAFASGHYAEARAIYRSLEQHHPDRTDYAIWVGRLSGWLGDYASALSEFQSVLLRNPDNVEALLGKAYVLLWQHRYLEAEGLLRRSEALQPENPEISVAWAKRFSYGGNRVVSARYIRRALTLDLLTGTRCDCRENCPNLIRSR